TATCVPCSVPCALGRSQAHLPARLELSRQANSAMAPASTIQPAARVPSRRPVRNQYRIDLLSGGSCMKFPLFPLTLLAAGLLLVACDGGHRQQAGPRADAQGSLHYGGIAFAPCALAGPGGSSGEAQCATLAVPEDHAAPAGRTIELAIALVPAKGMAEADPIYMIAGGPGQSAIESFPQVAGAFSDVRRNRHVILVDARGTGGSNPLHCPGFMDEAVLADPQNETPEAVVRLTEACRDALQERADLRFYTTGDHVRDLDLVRQRIGVERINLVGISYGT